MTRLARSVCASFFFSYGDKHHVCNTYMYRYCVCVYWVELHLRVRRRAVPFRSHLSKAFGEVPV